MVPGKQSEWPFWFVGRKCLWHSLFNPCPGKFFRSQIISVKEALNAHVYACAPLSCLCSLRILYLVLSSLLCHCILHWFILDAMY